MTLRARLLSGLGLLVLAAVASSGWLILKVAQRELFVAQEIDARDTGERLMRLLAATMVEGGVALDDPAATARAKLVTSEWIARGVVRDISLSKDGVALVGHIRPDDVLGSVVGNAVVRRDGDSISVFGGIAGSRGDRAAVRMSLPGEDLIGRAIERAGWLVALAALLCAAAVSLFGAVYVDRIALAIVQLAAAARHVASGDLGGAALPEAPDGGGDELQRLARDFNEMTTALRRERATVTTQRDTLVAQEKLATVGRLAAGVAHEIGNPLAAIIGFADMLRSDDGETQAERRLSSVDRADALIRIHGEAVRIQAIIREMLDYSRPPTASLEAVDLREAASHAVSLLRQQPRFRDVDVETAWSDALPKVLGERARVEQILVNLLLNAADALNGRGRVRIVGSSNDAGLTLAVEDGGPGVPATDRDKIFDPFFSTKDAGHGTGLGLSVSQAIASAMGASLSLDGDHQPGARFVLFFPRDRFTG